MADRAAYMRKWRAQNRGKGGPFIHGTEQGYGNYGCRCDDCREAHRLINRAIRRAQQRVADAHRAEYLLYLEEEKLTARIDGEVER